MNTDTVTLLDDGDIMRNGECVGYLGWSENMLVDIFVKKSYRNEGIATSAVEQMVASMYEDGYTTIITTPVMSEAMERVLEKNGFDARVVEDPLFTADDLDIDVSEDDLPTEEVVKWELPLNK